MSNVDVKDTRHIKLRWQRVLQQCSEYCRLVNRAAVKWNANDQRTLMSGFPRRQTRQLLSQSPHFQCLSDAGTMRLYHSHTAANTRISTENTILTNHITAKSRGQWSTIQHFLLLWFIHKNYSPYVCIHASDVITKCLSVSVSRSGVCVKTAYLIVTTW